MVYGIWNVSQVSLVSYISQCFLGLASLLGLLILPGFLGLPGLHGMLHGMLIDLLRATPGQPTQHST